MASIGSKNTKIELKVRKLLWSRGHRYRIHFKLLGKPDLVFPSKKIIVFIDGDFWHGYQWAKLRKKLKNDFWVTKILTNMKRDKRINARLKKDGWLVLRFWEHDINNSIQNVISKIESSMTSRL